MTRWKQLWTGIVSTMLLGIMGATANAASLSYSPSDVDCLSGPSTTLSYTDVVTPKTIKFCGSNFPDINSVLLPSTEYTVTTTCTLVPNTTNLYVKKPSSNAGSAKIYNTSTCDNSSLLFNISDTYLENGSYAVATGSWEQLSPDVIAFARKSGPSVLILKEFTLFPPPTVLTITSTTPTSIGISWVDNSVGETGFKIERSLTTGTGFAEIASVGANITTYNDTGLSNGVTYFYRVRGYKTSLVSVYTNEASSSTILPSPSILSIATVAPTTIQFSWTDNSVGETGFKIERSLTSATGFSQIATVGPNITSYLDTGLSNGSTYFYRVRAYRSTINSSYSNEASFATVLPQPTILIVSGSSSTTVDLSWTDNSVGETGFKIERSLTSGSGFTQVGTSASNTFHDTGLDHGTNYYYRVRAYTSTVNSDYSNEIDAVTVLPAPSSLVATANGSSEIDLSWIDNSIGEWSFFIERSTTSGSGYALLHVTGPNETSYVDTGVSNGITYYYRVKAYKNGISSAYSNESFALTTIPAPTNLLLTAVSFTTADLSWTDNSTGVSGFKIERSLTSGFGYFQVGISPTNTFHDSGLNNGTHYFYRVRAYTVNADSAYTNEVEAVTQLSAPTSLLASAISGSSINLSWTDNSTGGTSFYVERSLTSGSGYTLIFITLADAVTYTDTGLNNGATYYYRVRGQKNDVPSDYTNESNATTPVPAPSSLLVTSSTSVSNDLSWVDNSTSAIDGFKIERSLTSGTGYSQIATTTFTSYHDANLTNGTHYFYRVRAYKSAINSNYSNEADAFTYFAAPAQQWTYISSQSFSFLGGPFYGGPSPTWSDGTNTQRSNGGVSRTMSHRQGEGIGGNGDFNGDGYMDVVVAAPYYNVSGHPQSGQVWVFYGSASGLPVSPSVIINAPLTLTNEFSLNKADQAEFGSYVGSIGDVNNDGYADLIVTAPGWDRGPCTQGITTTCSSFVTLSTCQAQSQCYWDPVTPLCKNNQGHVAEAWIDTIIDTTSASIDKLRSNGPVSTSAAATSACGDNTDTRDTLVACQAVGTSDLGTNNVSSVNWKFLPGSLCDGKIMAGTNGDPNAIPTVTSGSETSCMCPKGGVWIFFGDSVANGGLHTNYADVSSKKPWLVEGKLTNNGNDATTTAPNRENLFPPRDNCAGFSNLCEGLGNIAASIGDIDGDGITDFAIGYQSYDEIFATRTNGTRSDPATACAANKGNQGRVYVFRGVNGAAPSTTPYVIMRNPDGSGCQDKGHFGSWIAAGDANGDGINDIAIAADHFERSNTAPTNENNEGRVYYWNGADLRTGFATNVSTGIPGNGLNHPAQYNAGSGFANYTDIGDPVNECDGHFGANMSFVDTNGDGLLDLMVASPQYGQIETSTDNKEQVAQDGGYGVSKCSIANGAGDTFNGFLSLDGQSIGQNQDEGAVYVFRGASATGITFSNRLTSSSRQTVPASQFLNPADNYGAFFGNHMGLQGDMNDDGYGDLSVGAFRFGSADGQAANSGRIYHYNGSSTGLTEGTGQNGAWHLAPTSSVAYGEYGRSVVVGDVNGDGFPDLLTAAHAYSDGTYIAQGKAFLNLGGVAGFTDSSVATNGSFANDFLGKGGIIYADLNGDGFEEILAGAPNSSGLGRVYVQNAANTGLSAGTTLVGVESGGLFGQALAKGDFDHDGFIDVVVGAPFDGSSAHYGKVYLYKGQSASPFINVAPYVTLSPPGTPTDAHFGSSVATGDFDGDGFVDIAISAPGINSVYIYLNNGSGSFSAPIVTLTGTVGTLFGQSLAMTDVNADGKSDLIIGAPGTSNGTIYVYNGRNSGFTNIPDVTVNGAVASSQFGWAIIAARDIDGDGYSDVAVGAPGFSEGIYTSKGAVYVYRGGASGLSGTVYKTIKPVDESGAQLGYSLVAGEFDGDNTPEILIGVPFHDEFGKTDVGEAVLYYAKNDSTTLIHPPSTAHTGDSFGYSVSSGDVHGDRFTDMAIGMPQLTTGTLGQILTYVGGDGNPGVDRRLKQSVALGSVLTTSCTGGKQVTFTLRSINNTPAVGPKVMFDVEVKPLGTAFDGTPTFRSASITSGASGTVNYCATTGKYKWRARQVTYSSFSTGVVTNNPSLSNPVLTPNGKGRWLGFGDNGGDADFIVP